MATFTVTKRKNKTSTSWQYDVKHPSFKSGKKRKSGFKTKAEATNAAQQLIRDLEDGNLIENNKKFEEYYNNWLIANGKDKLSEKQQYWYAHALDLFLDHFGQDILIKNITRNEYQKFISNYSNGRTSETVRKVHLYISSCIKDAIYDGYLKKDPTYKVNYKGTKAPKKEEVKFLTMLEYENLREYFKRKSDKSTLMLYILLITGARFSEVNRMTYQDLNYKPGLIHLPGSKTENADREIEISNKDLNYIKKSISNHPLRIDGKLFNLSHNAISKVFKKAKEEFNIDDEITPYSLRHTHASYLISKGISIEYISKRLGHANISITLEVYTHLLDEHKKEQGQRVRELFS
ncbi:site-specific integrase [Staphylococcus xylosus]|uniref:tyrosine-type recombinase/integrase n=1 Tax=Staphylococcus xylosus TaxID=1288 RepID=UPI000E69CCF7|nr:site-specific integrase [Staphylococcus xylosus]RIM84425.1 site-specific integrase [Staphylococcus xylosus]